MPQEGTPTADVLRLVGHLATLEQPSWPQRLAAIPAWHPRNEDDPAPEPDDPSGDDPADDPDDAPGQEPDQERVTKANREAAKYRRRARDAEKRLKDIEDAGKSDLDKLSERAETAERELGELRTRELRRKIAAKHDLPAYLADRLQGDDEDALEADAEELAKQVAPAGRPGMPQPPRGGQSRGDDGEDDPRKLAAKVPRMY